MNIVLFGALAFAAIKLVGILQNLTPRLVTIERQISDVVKKVQDLTQTVHEKINSIGGRASATVGSVEGIAQSASRQFERYSPFVIGSLTAIRLVKALTEVKKGRSLGKATSRKGILKKSPPKSLLGKVLGAVRR